MRWFPGILYNRNSSGFYPPYRSIVGSKRGRSQLIHSRSLQLSLNLTHLHRLRMRPENSLLSPEGVALQAFIHLGTWPLSHSQSLTGQKALRFRSNGSNWPEAVIPAQYAHPGDQSSSLRHQPVAGPVSWSTRSGIEKAARRPATYALASRLEKGANYFAPHSSSLCSASEAIAWKAVTAKNSEATAF